MPRRQCDSTSRTLADGAPSFSPWFNEHRSARVPCGRSMRVCHSRATASISRNETGRRSSSAKGFEVPRWRILQRPVTVESGGTGSL